MTKLEELARTLTARSLLGIRGQYSSSTDFTMKANVETEFIKAEVEAALKPLLEEMYDVAETLDDLGGNFAGLVIKLRPMLAEWYEPEGHERGER